MAASSDPIAVAKPSAEILLELLENSALACILTDHLGKISRWSDSAAEVFGWPASAMLGRPAAELFDTPEAAQELFRAASVTRADVVLHSAADGMLDAKIWVSPLGPGPVAGRLMLVLDVSEKKFLERALLEAAEREQRRIGQELHDHLCQHLLGAAFAVKALAGEMDRAQPPLAPQLHDLARLINDAVGQVRDISRGLHPVEMDSAGLMSALQELSNRASRSVPCEFCCESDVLVPDPAVALNAYRIAQEAVTGALQGGGSQIRLILARKGSAISLEVTDDGTVARELTDDPAGTAARTLQYRAHAMGGELTATFSPTSGTRVACLFPS